METFGPSFWNVKELHHRTEFCFPLPILAVICFEHLGQGV
jgi:hypothetical protein